MKSEKETIFRLRADESERESGREVFPLERETAKAGAKREKRKIAATYLSSPLPREPPSRSLRQKPARKGQKEGPGELKELRDKLERERGGIPR